MALNYFSRGFHIFIKTMNGQTFMLDVGSAYTVKMLKEDFQEKSGYTTNEQKLVFNGAEVEDGRTMSSYNIQKESTLHLILKLQGIVLIANLLRV